MAWVSGSSERSTLCSRRSVSSSRPAAAWCSWSIASSREVVWRWALRASSCWARIRPTPSDISAIWPRSASVSLRSAVTGPSRLSTRSTSSRRLQRALDLVAEVAHRAWIRSISSPGTRQPLGLPLRLGEARARAPRAPRTWRSTATQRSRSVSSSADTFHDRRQLRGTAPPRFPRGRPGLPERRRCSPRSRPRRPRSRRCGGGLSGT